MGANEDQIADPQDVFIDWQSEQNHVLLNPRWPRSDAESLQEVAGDLTSRFQIKGHIWLATSGSTSESVGMTKLVALSKQAFLASATAVNSHLEVSSNDKWLQVLPRFHVGGLGTEVRAALSGSEVFADLDKWEPLRITSCIENHRITLVSLVPAQVFDLVQAGCKAPSLVRAVVVGGGALTESLYSAARALGWPLLPSYGMTETCSQIATAPLSSLVSSVHSSSGVSKMPAPEKLDHVQWRTSSEGLLQVHGSSLLSFYGQRQKDGSVIGWDPKQQGWFETEDFVQLHEKQIRFQGRRHDFIKIGGEGSSMARLREIFERSILVLSAAAHEGVSVASQAVLVDAPSSRLGTEIHLAHTQRIDPQLLLELKEKYNQEVLPFERVRELKTVAEIPRSDLGKILWAQLKKELYGD